MMLVICLVEDSAYHCHGSLCTWSYCTCIYYVMYSQLIYILLQKLKISMMKNCLREKPPEKYPEDQQSYLCPQIILRGSSLVLSITLALKAPLSIGRLVNLQNKETGCSFNCSNEYLNTGYFLRLKPAVKFPDFNIVQYHYYQ